MTDKPKGLIDQLQETADIAAASKEKGQSSPRGENVEPPSGTLLSLPGSGYKLFFGWVSTNEGRIPALGRFQDQGRLEMLSIFLGEAEMNAALSIVATLDGSVVLGGE